MKTIDKSRRQRPQQARRSLRAEIRRISGEQMEAPSLTSGVIAAMIEATHGGTTRREFLKSGMVAAGALALPGGVLAAGLGSAKKPGPTGTRRMEPRSFVFDLSWADTSNHDVVLVAHPYRHRLRRLSPAKRNKLRAMHPVLHLVPDARMTHHVDVDMPAESVQWCYLQRFVRGRKNGQDPAGGNDCGSQDGSWAMLGTFIHHPTRALLAAAAKEHARLGAGEHPKVPDKWKRHGLTGEQLLALADPVGLDVLKDSNDTAATMVTGHPEVLCLDDTNSAYIQNTIVSQNTDNLAGLIEFQGPAEQQVNWVDCSTPFQANSCGYATLVPICNPDTGEPRRDSQTGEIQCMPEYSDTTNSSLNSDALQPSLAAVKQDITLGSNNGSNPDSTQGVIWRSEDGVTTSAQTETSLGLGAALSYTARDFSPGHGYSVTITDVDDDPSDPTVEALISIEVKNWFVRFLGLYVRYLDSDGQIIPPDQVASELGASVMDKYFDFHDCCEFFDTSQEVFLTLLFPEFEIFGMPVSETSKKLTIPMPSSATSILILASGMGSTSNASNPYSGTIATGTTMTGTVSLGITFFFLALAAAAAAAPFSEALQDPQNTKKLVPLFLELFVDLFENDMFHNPGAFKGVGVKVGALLMGNAAKPILTFLAPYIAEAEDQEAVLDAIPLIGAAYSAFVALGTLAQLAQTAIEVATSPSTYAYEVTLTHDIEVTVRPNLSPPPDGNPNGWPATATHFDVIAHFNGGTPTSVRVALPLTQTTDPQVAIFRNVPLGGQVAMSVGVYSDTNFLVGSANAGPVDNNETVSFDITFKELLVPLDASTVYSHKEVIALNAAGQHVWQATTVPPVQAPRGCSPSNGQLCSLNGVTVNSASGDVGQSFQSYNNAVPNCGNPNSFSNGHQFSNISSGQNPESAFFFTGCTFPNSPKLVYDLLNRNHANFYLDTSSRGPNYQGVIRQVRLSDEPNPGFDAPDSNLAWGKLQHPSDSLLLHPAGKIVSVASTKNKFEVIDLPDAARSDADAPFSHTYGAQGLRPGLMDGPVLAALDPDGTILVIEGGNRRIQAFDLNGNPAPIFPGGAYFVPLKDQPVSQYLDFAIEFKGYMYVLSIVSGVFTLDIYDPDGTWLSATRGFEAQRLAVNYWRDVYTQNAHVLTLPNGAIPARTEPSVSHWIPSTP